MMISVPDVMGQRDLLDVPLVDNGHQYKTHQNVRPELTFSENTLPTLIH